MKNKLLLAVACLFLSVNGFTQTYYSSDPTSGIVFCAGITSSNVLNDSVSSSNVTSLTGGLKYRHHLSEKFSITAGALYTGKGYKRDKPMEKYRYYYLDIPLYLQYHIVPDVRVDLGAQYSVFSMGNVTKLDDSKSGGVDHKKVSGLRSTDYGPRAGINFRMHDNFDIAAQYYLSLSAFDKAASPGDFSVVSLQVQYYMVRFYNKGKKKEEPQPAPVTPGS